MNVCDILRDNGQGAITIVQTETVQTAINSFNTHKVSALVVRDGHGNLSGIITERDIIHIIAARGASGLSYRVEDVMTREVKTCKATASVSDVMGVMSRRRVRHVPVVESGELLGMITSKDIIKSCLSG